MLAYVLLLLGFLFPTVIVSSLSLDEALLFDMFEPPGTICGWNIDYTRPDTSYTFDYTPSESYWDPMTDPFEKYNFLAEMSNEDESNPDRSWKMRIGHGGNIYSFRGAFGEAVPPQHHESAPFIDEIPQMVVTDHTKIKTPDTPFFFIHQAGTYMKDKPYTDLPFYSPNVAKFCRYNTCAFASWGQQAPLTTYYKSHALYYTMYTDCGNGFIEHTQIVHNSENNPDKDILSYLNIPWSAVRKSTLQSMFVSKPRNSTQPLEYRWPIHPFGRLAEDLSTLGGYTTFSENVIIPDKLYESNPVELPEEDGEIVKFVIKKDTLIHTQASPGHSDRFKQYCVFTQLEQTIASDVYSLDVRFFFTNKRTGFQMLVEMIIHWSHQGLYSFYCPGGNITADEINEKYQSGDEIIVTNANYGKPIEENKALTFIHGFENPQLGEKRWASSRLRYGDTRYKPRDTIVYTINPRVFVEPGDTYMYRQYIMASELSAVEEEVYFWVPEAYDDLYETGELVTEMRPTKHGKKKKHNKRPKSPKSGSYRRKLKKKHREKKSKMIQRNKRVSHYIGLYSDYSNTHFGASVGDDPCYMGDLICTGISVPSKNTTAHFFMTCGEKTYVGSDRYHFSPPQANKTDTLRPYACDGEDPSVRPSWKLLGYFEDGSCENLVNSTYQPYFCSGVA